jgi:hypothetical protein
VARSRCYWRRRTMARTARTISPAAAATASTDSHKATARATAVSHASVAARTARSRAAVARSTSCRACSESPCLALEIDQPDAAVRAVDAHDSERLGAGAISGAGILDDGVGGAPGRDLDRTRRADLYSPRHGVSVHTDWRVEPSRT